MKKTMPVFILMLVLSMLFSGCTDKKTNSGADGKDIDSANNTDTPAETSEPTINPDAPLYDVNSRTERPPLDSKANFVKWRLERIKEKEKMVAWRWDRAAEAILRKDITEERVLEAFLSTPREVFARDESRAYEDAALGIRYGQTISGPHMVCKTTNELNPDPDDKVLEIGTGSGYQSAVFAYLTNYIYTIEIVEPLAKETAQIQEGMYAEHPEYQNIKRKVADGYYGWPEYAPFDRIAVTCGIDHIPPPLLEQLAPDGIMLIPVGPPDGQTMLRVTKTINADGSVTINREDVYKGKYRPIFVPFTNSEGQRHSVEKDKPNL